MHVLFSFVFIFFIYFLLTRKPLYSIVLKLLDATILQLHVGTQGNFYEYCMCKVMCKD
jgi:hypothetical protein